MSMVTIMVTAKKMRKAGSPVPAHVLAIAEAQRIARLERMVAQQAQRAEEVAQGIAPLELSKRGRNKKAIHAKHYRRKG